MALVFLNTLDPVTWEKRVHFVVFWQHSHFKHRLLLRPLWCTIAMSLLATFSISTGVSQEAEKSGKLITLEGPLTAAEVVRIQRAVRLILDDHLTNGKRPVLIFEIRPGASQYEECRKLVHFIRNTARPGAENTIAYVPEPLTGHKIMIALACQELVMHTDASIGNITGNNVPKPDSDQRILYRDLARDRNWPEALVLGMLDPDLEIYRTETPDGSRFTLPDDKAIATGPRAIYKPRGEPLILKSRQCRTLSLAKLIVPSRAEIAAHYQLPRQATLDDPTLGVTPEAVVIHVDGVLDPIMRGVLFRSIDRALSLDKNLIIFRIDSPGGLVDASFDIANRIKDLREIRTIAYVPKGTEALSGAAFVALGCDEIYMDPESIIGDAGPVKFDQGGMFEHAEEKFVSLVAKQIGDIAEFNGRPRALAEAMVNRNLVVKEVRNKLTNQRSFLSDQELRNQNNPDHWEVQRIITTENLFLTLNGHEAEACTLIDGLVHNQYELWEQIGISEAPPEMKRTWVDTLVYFLNSGLSAFLLIFLGTSLLFMEISVPGLSIAGIGSSLCFMLFFWSRFLGGTAGWLEVLLFLAGIVFLSIEIFVIPGFGIAGISGILFLFSSLILASQTFYLPRSPQQWGVTMNSISVLLGALLLCMVAALVMGKYAHRLPLFRQLVLSNPAPSFSGSPNPSGKSNGLAYSGYISPFQHFLGKQGTAVTDLRPAGKAQFDSAFLDVVADGYFIPMGQAVQVIEISGNRIVVKQV